MSQFDERNGFEASCRAQLSNVLEMPTRLDISSFQNSEFGDGSNHTTPLNYMRKVTPKSNVPRSNQGVVYSELEEDRELEIENRFHGLQIGSSSNQNNFFELHKSHTDVLEALEPSKDVPLGELRMDSLQHLRKDSLENLKENTWDYSKGRQLDTNDSERFGSSELNIAQLGYNSNSDFSLQPERRYDGQLSQQIQQPIASTRSPTSQGLGLFANNASSYLVIAPDGNGYASELDTRRNQQNQQQQPSLYGLPPQVPYSSSASNTPKESWNNQNGQRRSAPATPSVLSSYATASAQPGMQPPQSTVLNKYNQPSPHMSQYHSQAQHPGEYGPQHQSRSPHYGEEARLQAERASYLGEQPIRGMSPKYAAPSPRHAQQAPPGYYPPQQAPQGYGAPPSNQYGQQSQHGMSPHHHHHHQSAAGYYPPGNAAPPNVQPDLMYQVQFKRISKSYTNRSGYQINLRDFVVVEGDRGEDIGVVIEVFSMQEFMHRRMVDHRNMGDKDNHTVDCILRLATMHERQQLPDKFHTEKSIVQSCNELAMYGFGLPIMVYDAEFQFDRNKLTIYYECNVRIDFRDFVRQLYSTYKARIWMKIGNVNTPLEVQPLATMALATGVQFSNGNNTGGGGI